MIPRPAPWPGDKKDRSLLVAEQQPARGAGCARPGRSVAVVSQPSPHSGRHSPPRSQSPPGGNTGLAHSPKRWPPPTSPATSRSTPASAYLDNLQRLLAFQVDPLQADRSELERFLSRSRRGRCTGKDPSPVPPAAGHHDDGALQRPHVSISGRRHATPGTRHHRRPPASASGDRTTSRP